MDTRRLLLENALELFAQFSYEGCGVQQICERSDVTKPTLYHYFGSKRGILDTLVFNITQPLIVVMGKNLYAHDLPNTLTCITRDCFGYATKRPLEFRYYASLLLAPPGSESRKAVEPAAQRITEAVTRIFIEASEDHGNMRNRQIFLTAVFSRHGESVWNYYWPNGGFHSAILWLRKP